jgi:hypothetical protein
MTCYWPGCGQDALAVITLGCLSQLHVITRLVCNEHFAEITGKQKKGRVYCADCHGDGEPWENLYPVDMIMSALL